MKSQKEFRDLLEEAPLAITLVNAADEIEYINRKNAEIIGYTLDETPTLEAWWSLAYPDPEERKEISALWGDIKQRVLSGENIGKKERTITCKDGVKRDMELSYSRSGDKIIVIFNEVTERKRMEDLLRRKEHVLSESQRLGHIGSWFFDRTGLITWSDELYRIYGVSSDTFTPTEESMLSLIHPDDRPAMKSWIAACAAGDRPVAMDFRVTLPDGTVRFIRGFGEAVFDTGSRLLYMAGLGQDITERKMAETALRESENRFRGLFDSSRDAIMTLEPPAWKFTSGNPAAMEMFGTKNEDHFVSMGPWELSPELQPDGRGSAEKAREMIEMALREGHNLFEWTHRRVSGQSFPATVLLSRMELTGKIFLQATVRDITEHKKAAEALRQKVKELEEAMSNIKVLSGLLPICQHCKKIRDDAGYWNRIESYIMKHSDAEFSHGICDECLNKLYPEEAKEIREDEKKQG